MATNYVVLVDGSCYMYGTPISNKDNAVTRFFCGCGQMNLLFSIEDNWYSEYKNGMWIDSTYADYKGTCLLYALTAKPLRQFFFRE